MSLRKWWREDRPVYVSFRHMSWGWLGNGWNRLGLGPVAIYFGSGLSPVARLQRRFGRG